MRKVEGTLVSVRGEVGSIVTWPPIKCRCGRVTAFLINRGGSTHCL